MPIICSICDKVIIPNWDQPKKAKPICRDCLNVALPKALEFVKTHNEGVVNNSAIKTKR